MCRGRVNIPLPQLRARLGELPRDREIHVICRSGQRAYYATRILLQNGFKARNISGGMLSRSMLWQSEIFEALVYLSYPGDTAMKAITVEPLKPGTARYEDVPEPDMRDGSVLVEAVAVGVCGTDVEIVEGKYGWAPAGQVTPGAGT